MNKYPIAVNKEMVGEYPALCKSGGGYFFDHVLEYRVWCHPERGANDEFEGEDYYYPFDTYEDALEYSNSTKGTEEPLALIRQMEWIDEPEPGVFHHKKEERITEWLPIWLEDGPRKENDIEFFIKEKLKANKT